MKASLFILLALLVCATSARKLKTGSCWGCHTDGVVITYGIKSFVASYTNYAAAIIDEKQCAEECLANGQCTYFNWMTADDFAKFNTNVQLLAPSNCLMIGADATFDGYTFEYGSFGTVTARVNTLTPPPQNGLTSAPITDIQITTNPFTSAEQPHPTTTNTVFHSTYVNAGTCVGSPIATAALLDPNVPKTVFKLDVNGLNPPAENGQVFQVDTCSAAPVSTTLALLQCVPDPFGVSGAVVYCECVTAHDRCDAPSYGSKLSLVHYPDRVYYAVANAGDGSVAPVNFKINTNAYWRA